MTTFCMAYMCKFDLSIQQTLLVVEYKAQKKELPIIITEGDGPSLLGRNWLEELKLHELARYVPGASNQI